MKRTCLQSPGRALKVPHAGGKIIGDRIVHSSVASSKAYWENGLSALSPSVSGVFWSFRRGIAADDPRSLASLPCGLCSGSVLVEGPIMYTRAALPRQCGGGRFDFKIAFVPPVFPNVMGEYDATLGFLLLGAFLNTGLYGVVSVQYVWYWTTEFNDPFRVKALVGSLFSLDTVNSASLVYMAWVYGVENYNNPQALRSPIWPLPFTLLIAVVIAFLVQMFLTYRVFRLTERKLASIVISLFAVMTLVAGLICSATAWKINSYDDAVNARTTVAIWLSLQMGVDVLISSVLVWVLSRSRTQFHRSNTIIDRLIRGSLQSGFLAGLFAMASLALFLSNPTAQYYALVAFSSPRVYSITLMDTLLVRHDLRAIIRGSMGSKQIDTTGIWELDNLGNFTHSSNRSDELQFSGVATKDQQSESRSEAC
ncbi:putative expressed protein [Lyophyllum shimeji]|uniref:Expressed protein n=1 Tax=Lyophyllum shimeji TaxID=47721 RepID=A0A9P3PPR6_LYOSH|nr:putative expressed protein [Lyophyllum shimeji]